jgi:hypothetical protein
MREASRRSLRARPPRRWRMPFRLRRSNLRELPEEPRGVGGCRRASTQATARCRKRIPMGAHLKYAAITVALAEASPLDAVAAARLTRIRRPSRA